MRHVHNLAPAAVIATRGRATKDAGLVLNMPQS